MKRMHRRLATVLVLGALSICAVARAEEGIEERATEHAEPTYADKPASWWIAEILDDVRNRAAREVVRTMGARAAPALTRALEAPHARKERITLLGLLAPLKDAAAPALPEIRKSLRSGNATEVEAALRVIAVVGDAARPAAGEVADILADESSKGHRTAAVALRGMGAAALPYRSVFADRLLDDDVRTRITALEALAAFGDAARDTLPQVEAHIREFGFSPYILRATLLIDPGSEIAAESIQDALARISEDTYYANAVQRLLTDGLPVGPALRGFAERVARAPDVNTQTLNASARALGRYAKETGEISETLFALLESADLAVASTAARALQTNLDAARPHADRIGKAFLESAHPRSISNLMLALIPTTTEILVHAAMSDNDTLRNVAWRALERIDAKQLAIDPAQLRAVLFDTRVPEQKRWQLLNRLANGLALSDEARRSVLIAVALELRGRLATTAIWQLARDGGPIEPLLPLMKSADQDLAVLVITEITTLHHANASVRDAVLAALRDKRPVVRAAALAALVTMTRAKLRGALASTRAPLTQEQRADVWRAVGEKRELAGDALRFVLLGTDPAREIPRSEVEWLLTDARTWFLVADVAKRGGYISDETLKELIDATDPIVALRAAALWSQRGGDAATVLDRIKAGFDADDDAVRRVAVIAATTLTDEQLVQLGGGLLRVLDARGRLSAHAASAALTRILPWAPSVKQALFAIADDPEHPAHASAPGCMVALGDEGHERLVALLKSPVRDARRNAAVSLLQMESNQPGSIDFALNGLRAMVKADDLELADIARQALGEETR